MAYIIYSESNFEGYDGTIHKGDEINIIHGEKEDEMEIRQWLINQYVLDGIDVSYQLSIDGKKIGEPKKITKDKILGCEFNV